MGNRNLKISAVQENLPPAADGRKILARFSNLPPRQGDALSQEAFHTILTFERRRAERSRKPFALMLLDSHAVHKNGNGPAFTGTLATAISGATRETDIIG